MLYLTPDDIAAKYLVSKIQVVYFTHFCNFIYKEFCGHSQLVHRDVWYQRLMLSAFIPATC